jgi:hypothetical protein
MTQRDDPSIFRERERQLIQHVEKLLVDPRLRIDTTMGRRPVTGFARQVTRSDHSADLRRMMSQLGLPDRELEARMPVGETMEVTLTSTHLFVFKRAVGRLRVICAAPTQALLTGRPPPPMSLGDLQKLLASTPPPLGGVPTTILVMSGSGFEREAHEMADRRADRIVVLVSPNAAGGWSCVGPAQTQSLTELLDPEDERAKRERIREHIEANRTLLSGSGVAADQLAARTHLPVQLVEDELREYARSADHLAAKRLDGRVVLYRQGPASQPASDSGGSAMPLIDRVKSLFARKGETEKKIEFLSERRTALSQQRDRAYEELGTLEQQDVALRTQFKEASATSTKRRITSQLLQLQKDLERRQQLVQVLNTQVNVVSTHLHNLELVQQGQTAKLPDSDQITEDAVKAEEMLADLEASSELAGSVAQSPGGLNAEEQALYEQLEREIAAPAAATPAAATPAMASATPPRSGRIEASPTEQPTRNATAAAPRKSEPEAG